ncbi:hypothetical protein K435DRAFT_355873 [Dendrothele bispora CBS 962.96]|uniref:Uncharacterized protein n=1 Tax=Dendrothele bispora (strain CBS 962.96) TaxID=1314807 RepID=A0A4V4HDF8_DENBC|nr:hypothetical protein K435DRAFT_355873 [Dendrothele bispora CBS 962.96]
MEAPEAEFEWCEHQEREESVSGRDCHVLVVFLSNLFFGRELEYSNITIIIVSIVLEQEKLPTHPCFYQRQQMPSVMCNSIKPCLNHKLSHQNCSSRPISMY